MFAAMTAVLFCRDVGSLPLDVLGPWLEHHAAFPNRINAHFVRVDGRWYFEERRLGVDWERNESLGEEGWVADR